MSYYESFFLVIVSLMLYFYWNFKKKLAFFDKHGVPYVQPHWIFGNLKNVILLKKPLHVVCTEIYEKLEPHKFGGLLMPQKPAFLIRDVNMIKNIMSKDFAHFQNRGIVFNEEFDPLERNLFNMAGEDWKNLRLKLMGSFTNSKVKMMFPLVKECGEQLKKVLERHLDESFDIKDLTARYTTDVIGSCAFGLETRSLENPNSEFRQMGKQIFRFRYKTLARFVWPTMPKVLIKYFDLKYMDEKVQNFFIDIVNTTIKYREENNLTRNDFLDLLIALKNDKNIEKINADQNIIDEFKKFVKQTENKPTKSNLAMTGTLMAAQCFLFFSAGFGTTSNALSFLMMELALNKEIQDKVRNEIERVLKKHNYELTYDSIKEMTYTDMVISETLRKYPSGAIIQRQCNRAYQVPDSKLTIQEKMMIVIPVVAIHRDKKYYERPEDFYPEHFTEQAKAGRPHYAYIPFGEGPRMCIAHGFGKILVKVGLINMLQSYTFKISDKMKFPLEYKNHYGLLTVKNGIWLRCQKI